MELLHTFVPARPNDRQAQAHGESHQNFTIFARQGAGSKVACCHFHIGQELLMPFPKLASMMTFHDRTTGTRKLKGESKFNIHSFALSNDEKVQRNSTTTAASAPWR
jgi:hypothetical protein